MSKIKGLLEGTSDGSVSSDDSCDGVSDSALVTVFSACS